MLRAILDFYIQGFRSMTVGRQLWALIIVKLLFIFLVLRLMLMPDLLERDYPDDPSRAAAVRTDLINRTPRN
ncbi:MAG: DUF4492 domain-containing protein [Duncaniella sp.]|nr:DUF4492 domain-containing protein [Duncaniella sp.]